MPSPKRGAGKEKAMSNPTELEKLKTALQPAADEAASKAKPHHVDFWEGVDEAYGEVMDKLDAAIAAEKQRVCANCRSSEERTTRSWLKKEPIIRKALFALGSCPKGDAYYDTTLAPDGYCEEFAPREEQK